MTAEAVRAMRWRQGLRHLLAAALRDERQGPGPAPGGLTREELVELLETPGSKDVGDLLSRLGEGRRLSGHNRRKLARILFDRGYIRAARAAADGRIDRLLRAGTVDAIRRAHLMLTAPPAIPARRRPDPGAAPAIDVAYLAASALPDQVTGYTSRTQALVEAMIGAGLSVECLVRTGYPTDRRRDVRVRSAANERRVGPVRYLYDSDREYSSRFAQSADALLAPTVARIEARLAAARPRFAHAASNHVNALPALIAARRRGLPFVYEVRGLGEMSAATIRPGWPETERFALEAALETLVAREADLVVPLPEGLRGELVRRGVPAGSIRLLPNAVDTVRFAPGTRDPALAERHGLAGAGLAIVYAGSLVRYEGLDDLVLGVARARAAGVDCRLLLVGDGPMRETLQGLAAEAGIGATVRFIDPVPQGELPALLALADVCVFPRKDLDVCRIVSPLKPFEAMAAGVPVVVSRVDALREIVGDGAGGLVGAADDPDSVAAALVRLAAEPETRRSLAAAALDWVRRERSWQRQAAVLLDHYAAAGLPLRPELRR